MDFTKEETTAITLIKCWCKIAAESNSRVATKAFTKDWEKLQYHFIDRLGILGGRVAINEAEKIIEDYIKTLS